MSLDRVDLEGLNPFERVFQHEPWDLYRRLRAEDPVHRMPDGSWLLTRYEDCATALRDARFSVNPKNLAADAGPPNPLYQEDTPVMVFLDPPDHDRLRGLIVKAFNPKVLRPLEARIQEVIDRLLDAVIEQGSMDVIADLAYPLPVFVVCDLLGVPESDHGMFKAWSKDIARLVDDDLDDDKLARLAPSFMSLFAYFGELVEERRAAPRVDLVSELIAAEQDGSKLSYEELLGTLLFLFVAGHETTMNLVGNGMYALLRHPEQRKLLAEDPELGRLAVEEFLRFEGPVHILRRIAKTDIELGERVIGKGSKVTAVVASANRDEAEFEHPDELDIRRRGSHHLTFSGGVHFCLGAALARMEGELAFRSVLARLDDLELAGPPPTYRDHILLRGLETLDVTFAPGPRLAG